jgi:hypothetical protein
MLQDTLSLEHPMFHALQELLGIQLLDLLACLELWWKHLVPFEDVCERDRDAIS